MALSWLERLVRRFVPQTVDHWLRLLVICFTHYSGRRDIDEHHHLWANVLCT